MTEQSERETFQPAFGGNRGSTSESQGFNSNPWLAAMVWIGGLTVLIGIIVYGSGYESASNISLFDDDLGSGLVAMLIGQMMIFGGATLLVLWLAASAICWQLARKQP